jgi:branched-chain amino acid transport system substrate-binding protein
MTAGIPGTVDFAPIVRSIQAANPDILYLACYPLDSVGMVSAISEAGLRVKVFGGGLIGLQYAAVKHQLGPLLNGAPSFGTYVREPTMQFPGIKDFFRPLSEAGDRRGHR